MAQLSLNDGQRLFYETRGEGPPLVLVPGLGGVSSFWERVAPALESSFTLVLHDHRGCGRSSHVPGKFSVEQMADDLRQLLDHLEIERVRFLGHSTGGAIVQTLALDHPERVERLALSATWCGPEPYLTNLFRSRKAILESGGLGLYQKASAFFLKPPGYWHEHGEELETLGRTTVEDATEIAILAARLDALIDFDRRTEIGNIRQPALVICADDDMVTPPALSREITERIPDAGIAMLGYGGHFTPLVAPEAFLAACLGFLQA